MKEENQGKMSLSIIINKKNILPKNIIYKVKIHLQQKIKRFDIPISIFKSSNIVSHVFFYNNQVTLKYHAFLTSLCLNHLTWQPVANIASPMAYIYFLVGMVMLPLRYHS